MTTIDGVLNEFTGLLDRFPLTPAVFAGLPDDESEAAFRALSVVHRRLTTCLAVSAANIERRSRYTAGRDGLARRKGYTNAEAMLQDLSGGGGTSRIEARTLIEAGTMVFEADAARQRQADSARRAQEWEEERARQLAELEAAQQAAQAAGEPAPEPLPEPEPAPEPPEPAPWFAGIGDAVATGVLSTPAATAIRRGLGEPAPGVTEEDLTQALAEFIPEAATLNTDQASKAARALRDRIDQEGIASRSAAMKARQYLRVWDKPDGMLHGVFELDPENGSVFRDFMRQVAGPRLGGPRFTSEEGRAWAKALMDDPRPTDRILAESLIETLRLAAAADPMTMVTSREPSLKIVVGAAEKLEPAAPSPSASPSQLVVPPAGLVHLNGFIEGTQQAVPRSTIDRLLCTGAFTQVLTDSGGAVLDVGRQQRLFTSEQRLALAIRDGGCMMPNCNKPPSWTEAHHIDGFAEGGLTDLADGIMFCGPDHLRVHNDGWKVKRIRTAGVDTYWLIPPEAADPKRTPIRLQSKSPLKLGSPFLLARADHPPLIEPPCAGRMEVSTGSTIGRGALIEVGCADRGGGADRA